MDGWQTRCQGERRGDEKGVLMDSRGVKVVPHRWVRWRGVRTDDTLY